METDRDEVGILFAVMNNTLYPTPPVKWTIEGIDSGETLGHLFDKISSQTGYAKDLFVLRAVAAKKVFTVSESQQELKHLGFANTKKYLICIERANKYKNSPDLFFPKVRAHNKAG